MSESMVMDDAFAEALNELAGIDLTDVEEVRFESLPVMKGGFEIVGFSTVGRETKNGPRIFIDVKLQVVEVTGVADAKFSSPEEQAKLVGKSHNETFILNQADAAEGLGRLKAFLTDVGYAGDLKWTSMLNGVLNGHKFYGQVKHRPNPNDKDRPYCNVRPLKQAATAAIQV